jgi:allantoate deiminase
VVPGRVTFAFDVRAPDDALRSRAIEDIAALVARVAEGRGVEAEVELRHVAAAAPCDRQLSALLARSVARNGIEPVFLHSGAGHDAMSFHGILPIAMLFVRCRGGISHNPQEFASPEDIEIATRVLRDFVRELADIPLA